MPTKRNDKGNDFTFMRLLETHRRITEIFLEHQEALLKTNFPLARLRLNDYERRIKRHIRDEERWMIPLYLRAGKVPGGDPQLFIGEHRRMVEFIGRLKRMLPRRPGSKKNATRQAIEILYQEAMFRWLIDHHDERERQVLYPTLDRVTTWEERREVLRRCV